MFEYFNIPVLQNAISSKKLIQFSHNPINDDGYLGMEWDYIKKVLKKNDNDLVKIGEMWYAK